MIGLVLILAAATPTLPEVPLTMAGDLWVLGKHKLLVGDAMVPADIERLGLRADEPVTVPPELVIP